MQGTYNLTQSIVEELGVAIITGGYSSDKAFPVEAELCARFQVSRTVLREAVKMLTAKGLLSARPRQGTRVRPEESWNMLDPDVLRWLLERRFSLQLLQEFTQIRYAIEPMAAQLAAERADDAQLARIAQALGRMKAAEAGMDDPLESDIDFHRALLHASGNRFHAQLSDLITTALKFSIRFTNRYKGVTLASVEDHKAIYDAIAARDPEAAQTTTRQLVSEVLKLIRQARNERDDEPENSGE